MKDWIYVVMLVVVVYALFANDAALFKEISKAMGAWIGQKLSEPLQQ